MTLTDAQQLSCPSSGPGRIWARQSLTGRLLGDPPGLLADALPVASVEELA